MSQGLTLVVGPPGTGKTDVAVQIIVNLYHSHPNQKILIVTHSNAALNDLFEKIMQKDVDQRHLLRLGSGEKDLTTDSNDLFSKQGRVNWSLSRRMQLLHEIQRLAISLRIPGDVGYTCETAEYFFVEHILPRIESFKAMVTIDLINNFPFVEFFAAMMGTVFTGVIEEDLNLAHKYVQYVKDLFDELKEYRPYELLRTQAHRSDYLLVKQVITVFDVKYLLAL